MVWRRTLIHDTQKKYIRALLGSKGSTVSQRMYSTERHCTVYELHILEGKKKICQATKSIKHNSVSLNSPLHTLLCDVILLLIRCCASSAYSVLQHKTQHIEVAKMRQPTDNTSGCDKYILINTCIPQYLYSNPA